MNYSGSTCSPNFRSPVTQRQRQNPQKSRLDVRGSLEHRQRHTDAKRNFKFGCWYLILLAILCFDLWQTCPYSKKGWWHYLENLSAVLVLISAITCISRYLWWRLVESGPICVTEAQRSLLDANNDATFTVKRAKPLAYHDTGSDVDDSVPIINWHSSFEERRWSTQSPRRSPSPTRTPQQNSQHQQMHNQSYNCSMGGNNSLNASTLSNESVYMSPYAEVCRNDFPADVSKLPSFLKRLDRKRENVSSKQDDTSNMQNINVTNSFWNYCNNAAYMLKQAVYYMAPVPVDHQENVPNSMEEFGVVHFKDINSEVIKRISTVKLSQYLSNLRYWISTTILQRLVKQIDHIDEVFRQRGLSDIKIGAVGLERLRKMTENQQLVQSCAPMLPLLMPFLDGFSNQEYLVHRLKELSQGSCIADYRWNSGKSHNGQEWGEHLPTDAAILFHLFCVYMDSQLMPLPQGSGRPFHSRYVLIREEKRSTKDIINAVNNKAHCAILVSNSQLRPKFNFISEKELHNCAYDRNNLFYVIIQFLIHMRTHQESALEGVNLGRSGINVMCVVED